MTTNIQTEANVPYFGARAAGVILVVVLVSYIFLDVLIVEILNYLREIDGAFSLRQSSENKIRALKMVSSGIISPWLMLIMTLAVLKTYFQKETINAVIKKFGFAGRPSIKFLAASFVGGIAFVLLFTKILMHFFPPDQFAAPHPANVINYGPAWGILFFAVTAIIIVPVAEEFLFRGVLYQGFSRSWGRLIAAILASLIFISIHPDSIESGYWLTHLSLYIIPFLLILVREITGAIYGSIMVHSGVNFAAIFLN